jgi:hypothetical protein
MKRATLVVLLAAVACGRAAPLSTPDELRRSAFEQGLELLHGSGGLRGPHPVCIATRVEPHARRGFVVEDPSPGLVHSLRAAHPLMRKASTCTFTENEAVKGAFWLPGALLWVDSVSIQPGNRAVARIGYHVEPMYGAEFRCGFQLRERAWRVTRCDGLWVS